LLSPPGYSLWMCDARLAPGATITYRGPHSDDALYVIDGELDVDGRRCPPGGAVIVESGAEAVVTAVVESRVVHFGS
ncbi:MAG TPA: pirin-like C-terminal cupin domain-containing protein, partial [Ilumatobacteraceae bacterium]|nr:pirin-like C-terminal cupin domain-containing protein [Ilumatobacteraceae bacterium]